MRKTATFKTQIVTFVGISKKEYLKKGYFFTESAAFSGKSTNLQLLV